MKLPFINDKPIRLIELFGGIGSQAMALSKLGVNFEHYRLVEFDKYPVASYNAIHGTNFTPTDITEIHGEDLEIVDTDKYCYLMTYSFPLLMENVPQVHSKKNKGDFENWIRFLEKKGYSNYWQDLNAKDYGVAR